MYCLARTPRGGGEACLSSGPILDSDQVPGPVPQMAFPSCHSGSGGPPGRGPLPPSGSLSSASRLVERFTSPPADMKTTEVSAVPHPFWPLHVLVTFPRRTVHSSCVMVPLPHDAPPPPPNPAASACWRLLPCPWDLASPLLHPAPPAPPCAWRAAGHGKHLKKHSFTPSSSVLGAGFPLSPCSVQAGEGLPCRS